jgi:cysteine desulfurase/selenocysteine lyase
MSNVLGTVNPIDELAARAHAVGAVILVDGAQSVPHLPTNVQASAIDFLAFPGHKLFGPSGVGVLYGRRELLDAMDPFLTGGHMIAEVRREHSTWAEPPAKFEAGTLPIVPAIALATAIDYVNAIGFDAIHAHEQTLLAAAHARLAEIPGLRIRGPAIEHKGSIVSFTVERVAAEDLAQLLDHRGVFVRHGHHCTMPLHALLGVSATVRASFAFYNTLAEVEALAEGIEGARKRLHLS